VFQDAKRTVEASPELSALTKLYRDAIELPSFGSVYRVLSADSASKEGYSPTTVIFDEFTPNLIEHFGMFSRSRWVHAESSQP
jgi:phage terminase large subunit-like protein